MTKKIIKQIKKRKQKGESALITSLFVIAALAVFVFMYISTIGDAHIRIALDQIARKHMLLMESGSAYSIKDSIVSDIREIDKNASNINITVTVSGKNGTRTYSNPSVRPKASYGEQIKLQIKCTIKTTGYKPGGTSYLFGTLGKTKNTNYKVVKQSTAKY